MPGAACAPRPTCSSRSEGWRPDDGHPFTKGNKAMVGALAVSVPGAIRGFADAHRRFGRLSWAQVLEPAIAAAEAGVAFMFHDTLSIADRCLGIELLPDAAAALTPGGRPRTVKFDRPMGERLDTSALARTLKRVAAEGERAFYEGPVAAAIGGYLQSHGGILGADDLAAYRPRLLLEEPASYRGTRYVSCFDQVAYEALNILDGFDLTSLGADSFGYRHLVAEALAVAFADSMTHYGDPAFVRSPVKGLSSVEFAGVRRGAMQADRALPRPVVAGDPWPYDGNGPGAEIVTDAVSLARREGTSQAATADRDGNMASCCISLGSAFGSLVYVPEVGIFMNNAMQNYDPRPGLPNSIAPGKMPIFAAPALVATRNGRAVFAGSGSGGYRIETGVLHAFMNVVDHGMPLQAAVDHPRVHCQGRATHVDPRIGAQVMAALRAAGHEVVADPERPGGWPFGRVNAVMRDEGTGLLSGGAGPCFQTAVAGY
ncbi:MAG: gamma-glutamyltransferase [Hyphomicrobiaceae bacterium]